MAGRDQDFEPPSAALQVTHQQEAGTEVECPGRQPRTLMQNVDVPGGNLSTATNARSPLMV